MSTTETIGIEPSRSEGRSALLGAARAELAEHGAGGISLRAIARRAGVSHAAPKHHFGDRAGLLTALAADGFRQLGDTLRRVTGTAAGEPVDRLGALGRAYLDFGLGDPALFELMFRTELLHREDAVLRHEQTAAFAVLGETVLAATAQNQLGNDQPAPALSLIAWAFVHGLVALTRDGALQIVTATPTPAETAALARDLTEVFTDSLRGHPGS